MSYETKPKVQVRIISVSVKRSLIGIKMAEPTEKIVSYPKRASRSASRNTNYKVATEDLEISEDEKDEEYTEVGNNEEDVDTVELEEPGKVKKEPKPRSVSQTPAPVVLPSRGRPPKRKKDEEGSDSKRQKLPYPIDENGNPLPILNDEYCLPEDVEGESKITKEGDLLGGRQFVVRSFTVRGRGQIKYMLSTEPARAVGFRDSYLFFQYHPNLYKLVISQTDRDDLISRGVLPYSYRNRVIALVTARSVFREFGAKVIVDGKNITDDYYATKLRAAGNVKEGTYARDSSQAIVMGRNVHGIDLPVTQSVNPSKNAVEFFDKRNHNIPAGSNISSTNWLYHHAAACSRFNSDLFYDRERYLLIENLGVRDIYTNVLHIPQSTQSTKVLSVIKTTSDLNGMLYETKIRSSDLTRTSTGLIDVPSSMYEDILDEPTKQAIRDQQLFEQKL